MKTSFSVYSGGYAEVSASANRGSRALAVAQRVRPAQGDRTSCASSHTMDAADARRRTDEHSPLLRETASDEAMKGARAGRDEFNTRRPGLFVLGAVAVCGVFALATGKRPPAPI